MFMLKYFERDAQTEILEKILKKNLYLSDKRIIVNLNKGNEI